MSQDFSHFTVLLNEAVDGLAIKPNGIYVDGTFGRGGHSKAILEQLNDQGRLIAFDRDPTAIQAAKRFANDSRFQIVHAPFSTIESVMSEMSLEQQIDGVLLDLGVSSPQLDDAERGFSFLRDGPLDMRMDTSTGISAKDWLAEASVDDMTWVFKTFGEERFGKRIAHKIAEVRIDTEITRTLQLASIIDSAMPVKDKHKHPATRTFQAIRIYINSELEELKLVLQAALAVLKPEGRLSVISFHSLEDRMVKQFMRDKSRPAPIPKGLPIMQSQIDEQIEMRLIGKAIKPSELELSQNTRSRSSVLRIAEKLG